MTNVDAQHLLAFLKLYKGKCDNIWGPMSKEAMTEFQQRFGGLEVNGQLNAESGKALRHAVAYWYDEVETPQEPPSGDTWADSEFFDRNEFICLCNGKYCDGFPKEPEPELVRVCNEIRRRLGVPVYINSGVRCAPHNAAVGGASNSNHKYGKAADLRSSKSPQEMYRVAEEVLGNTGELGLYSWGIHVAVNCKYSRFYG